MPPPSWHQAGCCCGTGAPCTDCTSPTDPATSDGGKTPFDWGDACTWMTQAVYGAPPIFDSYADYCVWIYPQVTVDGGTANPQGVLVHLTYHITAETWDVEAYSAAADRIYSVYGLAKSSFICVGGELSGTATLNADFCVGDPDATFTI